MLLHLGAEWVVPCRYVLAILNLRTADSPDTRDFLRRFRELNTLISVPEGAPRSAVIAVDDKGVRRVYLSPISAATLKQRNLFAGMMERGVV